MLFKMNPELLSPEATKSLVKGLRKGMKDEMGVDVPQHRAQEVLARTLGYPNWHALLQRDRQVPASASPAPLSRSQQALMAAFDLAQEAQVKGVMIYVDVMNDETVMDLWVNGEGVSAETYHRHDVAAGTWPQAEALGVAVTRALGQRMEDWENRYFDLHETHDERFERAVAQGQLLLSDKERWIHQDTVASILSNAGMMPPPPHPVEGSLYQKALSAAFDLAEKIQAKGVIFHLDKDVGETRLSLWVDGKGASATANADDVPVGAFPGGASRSLEELQSLGEQMDAWHVAYDSLHEVEASLDHQALAKGQRFLLSDRDHWLKSDVGSDQPISPSPRMRRPRHR